MQPLYQYVRCGNHRCKRRYLYLPQNPLFLEWSLYWYGKPFGFGGQGIRRILTRCMTLCRMITLLLLSRLLNFSSHRDRAPYFRAPRAYKQQWI